MINTSSINEGLKETLEDIVDDPKEGEDSTVYRDWLDVGKMNDYYEDDLEMAGAGLASETPEGSEMVLGDIKQGIVWRYFVRKFAMKLIVTDEAAMFVKYDKIIDAGRRLVRAAWKTVDVDLTNLLKRGFNSGYPGADGVSLWNSAHPLPKGGSFSNIFATAMSPSRTAVLIARSMAAKMVGHDGITEGYKLRKVLAPVEQWGVWNEILGSTHAPEAGQFNAINVVNQKMNLSLVENPYWDTTTTNYAFLTDAGNGLKVKWAKRPKMRDWVDNDTETRKYGISYMYGRGWSEPRATIGVPA
jgi:hypothetical protein